MSEAKPLQKRALLPVAPIGESAFFDPKPKPHFPTERAMDRLHQLANDPEALPTRLVQLLKLAEKIYPKMQNDPRVRKTLTPNQAAFIDKLMGALIRNPNMPPRELENLFYKDPDAALENPMTVLNWLENPGWVFDNADSLELRMILQSKAGQRVLRAKLGAPQMTVSFADIQKDAGFEAREGWDPKRLEVLRYDGWTWNQGRGAGLTPIFIWRIEAMNGRVTWDASGQTLDREGFIRKMGWYRYPLHGDRHLKLDRNPVDYMMQFADENPATINEALDILVDEPAPTPSYAGLEATPLRKRIDAY